MRKKGTNVIWKQLGEKLEVMLQLISHFASILIYFIPLVKFHPHHELVLDEVHVLSSSNKDVMGESSIRDVFMNDYWGRPMTNWDSHKSWRPISVLSFRMLYGGVLSSSVNPILVARMINVVIHAALGEMVSVLALMLFPQKEKTSNGQPLYAITLRTMTKLLFVLHPSHVEAVANAANRPHLLALMFTILTLDPSWHILLTAIFFASALLSCETAIFQVPSIIITLAAIHWKRKKCVCMMNREHFIHRKQLTQYSFLRFSVYFQEIRCNRKIYIASSSSVLYRYDDRSLLLVCPGSLRHHKHSGWSDSTRRKSILFIEGL